MASRIAITLVVIISFVCLAQSQKEPKPLPDTYILSWTLYTIPLPENEPPFPNSPQNIPPAPYTAGRGMTYYDWSITSMLEVYTDYCVPIFSIGNNFSCDFLNTNGTSWLITYDDRPSQLPPCCIFEQPWSPPSPDFLVTSGIQYNETTIVNGNPVQWYVLDGPPPAPFGYGVYEDADPEYSVPAAFYFLAYVGFAQQNFETFSDSKPPASTWDIPSACLNAAPCPDVF